MEGEIVKYKLVDSMKTVRWLPLFIATPAKNMFTVGEKIRKNIWRNLILKMQEDKILVITSYSIHYTKLYEADGAGRSGDSLHFHQQHVLGPRAVTLDGLL